jgi:hypothetical protein
MKLPFAGGCRCGAIRYEGSVEPVLQANCHCTDCQKSTGSGYAPVFAVPKGSLAISGEPKAYTITVDSGATNTRLFCPNCGSQLFTNVSAMADIVFIKAGSLDDPSQYQPTINIYTASAQPWDHIADDIPSCAGMPEA